MSVRPKKAGRHGAFGATSTKPTKTPSFGALLFIFSIPIEDGQIFCLCLTHGMDLGNIPLANHDFND
ncbi:hypothetical protein IIA15_06175 [candidate division TA06 bacterium]|nr:hypothetical protein [candidate division TA06 bacterium]